VSLIDTRAEVVVGRCSIDGQLINDWRDIGFLDGDLVHSYHKGANSPLEDSEKIRLGKVVRRFRRHGITSR
jgi:hypothetical protein